MKPGNELLFLALGGSGEIGMNVNLYGCDGKWIMVDLGMTFADPAYPGVELVLPDLAFIEERKADLLGQPLFLQLSVDQAGRERRRVERHAEVGGEIGDGADMVLMAVGEDDAEQVVAILLDEGEVGQDQLDAGIIGVGEG